MAETTGPDLGTERRGSLFSGRDKLKPVKVPAPPEKPKKKRRDGGLIGVMSAVLTVGVILLLAATMGVGYAKRFAEAPGPLQSDRAVVVERGMGTEEIAELLEREGVISRPTTFQLMAMSKLYGNLKAGEFLFKREASLRDVIDTIANGRAIEHSITIPEGLTSEQIVARLNESDLLVGTIAGVPLEGTLLPDTYKIQRGTSRDALIARMQRDQKRIVGEVWAKRAKDLPVRTPTDLVTLASVVEKETGRGDERTRVASVFVNRLQKNMRLQSDPTIIYGLVGGKGSLGRGITQADIQSQTPYNTYVINGLPPGPIANPGRASLEAAANPSRTKDLFFVADGTGGHAFAETLEQHNRNVVRWRQIEAAAKATASPSGGIAPGFAPMAPPGAAMPVPPPSAATPAPQPLPRAPRGDADQYMPDSVPRMATLEPEKSALGARDASEGTAYDPLADKSFDLNSAQEVPAVRHRTRAETASFAVPLPFRMPAATADAEAQASARHARVDASEGTKLDPLSKANRAFDLNSPKTVPNLR